MSFNLTDWALRHRPFIGFTLVLLFIGGLFALRVIHQREDPLPGFRPLGQKFLQRSEEGGESIVGLEFRPQVISHRLPVDRNPDECPVEVEDEDAVSRGL